MSPVFALPGSKADKEAVKEVVDANAGVKEEASNLMSGVLNTDAAVEKTENAFNFQAPAQDKPGL